MHSGNALRFVLFLVSKLDLGAEVWSLEVEVCARGLVVQIYGPGCMVSMGFHQEADAPQYVRIRGLQGLLVLHRYVIDAIPRFETPNLPPSQTNVEPCTAPQKGQDFAVRGALGLVPRPWAGFSRFVWSPGAGGAPAVWSLELKFRNWGVCLCEAQHVYIWLVCSGLKQHWSRSSSNCEESGLRADQ